MKRLLLVFVTAMMVAGLVFAAGGGEDAADDTPIPLTFYRGGIALDWENDPIVQELAKRANVDLTFITAPWSENAAKINLMLSTGEKVDIITTVNDIPKWQDEGAIIAFDDYISEDTHPFIYKIVNSETFAPLLIDLN